jgi:hypothetical protein
MTKLGQQVEHRLQLKRGPYLETGRVQTAWWSFQSGANSLEATTSGFLCFLRADVG